MSCLSGAFWASTRDSFCSFFCLSWLKMFPREFRGAGFGCCSYSCSFFFLSSLRIFAKDPPFSAFLGSSFLDDSSCAFLFFSWLRMFPRLPPKAGFWFCELFLESYFLVRSFASADCSFILYSSFLVRSVRCKLLISCSSTKAFQSLLVNERFAAALSTLKVLIMV